MIEDVGADDTADSGSDSEGPVREASTAIDKEDEHLFYNRTHFKKDKIRHHFNLYYSRRRVVIERGGEVADSDERAPRVRTVLDAQGWTDMVRDHCPAVKKIVREFYVNLHQRHDNSFLTWIRRTMIVVTLTLISIITGTALVRNLVYPWPVDHILAYAGIVECFAKGRPHQIELDGEGSFQMSDFSNEVWCIYHILASWILPVISHMIITMEKARCLYTLLIEAPIDFSSLVISTMMSVRLTNKGVALPYRALVT